MAVNCDACKEKVLYDGDYENAHDNVSDCICSLSEETGVASFLKGGTVVNETDRIVTSYKVYAKRFEIA